MTVMFARDALDFFDMWFGSPHVSHDALVAVANPFKDNCPTIGITPIEWATQITSGSSSEALGELRDLFGGVVQVYPWFLVPNSAGELGLLREETMPHRRSRLPGFYVDVSYDQRGAPTVDAFVAMLEMAGIGPTLVTREGETDPRWRLWWRIDYIFGKPPRLFMLKDESKEKIAHLAWSAVIQAYANKFGFAPALDFNPGFRQGHMLYRLPGIDSVITHRGAPLDWRTATYHGIEERMEAIANLRLYHDPTVWSRHAEELAGVDDLPWDWIFKPVGWRSQGHGSELGMHHWSSPGGETVATTEGQVLWLRRKQSWTCGLKEVSDAGIVLDKCVVACVLGWDGDRAEFIDHWARTRTLYE